MDKKLHAQILRICDAALKAGGIQVIQDTVDVIQYANNTFNGEGNDDNEE